MTQVQITDFKYGQDRRRPRSSGVPGSLWTLKNAHISRGGDIERMKKWGVYADLPAGTFGLNSVYGQLITFGSADLASAMPLTVQYQRLQAPSGAALSELLDTQIFGDGIYAIARFADGSLHHFWKGVRVVDWDTIGATAISPAWVVYELGIIVADNPAVTVLASGSVLRLTAKVPGVPFTVTATGAGAVIIPRVVNVVPVAEVDATATITVVSGPATQFAATTAPHLTSVIIEGAEMIQTPIQWEGNAANMALAIAVQINEYGGFPGVRANAVGNVVTVTAADGKGATINGHAITVVTEPGLVVTPTNFAGGVTKVDAVAQITDVSFPGTIDNSTVLSVTINGAVYNLYANATNKGTNASAYKQRMWMTAGTLLRYSKLNDPGVWIDATAGFIDMPYEGDGAERLIGFARYLNNVAIFSTNQVRIWFLDVDPLKNEAQQMLNNTGTFAPQSIVQYGDVDVFYLDTPGIRSVKARSSGVNTAAVNDVGTGMDTWVQELIDTLPRSVVTRARGIIEPLDGRYMLAIDDKIIVLSVFANSKISAWSYYEPGFKPTAFARVTKQLYSRDDTKIYVLGGISGDDYPADDESPILVETPFMSANDPATFKLLNSFLCACTNVWDVSLLLDPNDETKEVWVGKVNGVTYSEPMTPLEGAGNLIALRMTCDLGGPASFSSFLIDFDKTK